ncbi:hypothetical protein AB0933_32540 [Streptomyces venezuelae]|uniref:hypothetical protein n=1 Tax=Streptomyces venezuelae TaxID=54571 RepID=UPI003456789D
MPRKANATREQIVEALQAGQSATSIARELRVDRARVRRIRNEVGIEVFVPVLQLRTMEEAWAQSTKPVEGGHLAWTGLRGSSGTPVMTYREQSHSPAAIAFRIRTGRDAQGQAFAECGLRHCVAPEHVHDEAERIVAREELHSGAAPAACRYGHDWDVHGRYERDGRAYCARCKWLCKNSARDDRVRPAGPRTPEEMLQQLSEEVEDGHVVWRGQAYRGSPGMRWDKRTLSPARLAFRMHHGRAPQGQVTRSCTVGHCIAGPCLLDQPMRQTERKVERLYDSIFGTAA